MVASAVHTSHAGVARRPSRPPRRPSEAGAKQPFRSSGDHELRVGSNHLSPLEDPMATASSLVSSRSNVNAPASDRAALHPASGDITAGRSMRAIVQDTYGSADVLQLREIDRPQIGADEVLIRV